MRARQSAMTSRAEMRRERTSAASSRAGKEHGRSRMCRAFYATLHAVLAERRVRQSLAYMPQLDSLRAAAVTIVMLWHFTSRDTFAREIAVNLGVRLFFVLSGFLITAILLVARDRIGNG